MFHHLVADNKPFNAWALEPFKIQAIAETEDEKLMT
jgi:hypothetical protein